MRIFVSTVTISKLRSPLGNSLLKLVVGRDALRVKQQGQPVRVIITEQEYFRLIHNVVEVSSVGGPG